MDLAVCSGGGCFGSRGGVLEPAQAGPARAASRLFGACDAGQQPGARSCPHRGEKLF